MIASRFPDRRRAKPAAIAGVVDQLVQSLGLTRQYHGWLMVSRWPEIVGSHYARKSRAIRFEDGTLYVAVARWRQQMALDTEKILDIIHSYPHGGVVKRLRLVWGEKGTRSNAD